MANDSIRERCREKSYDAVVVGSGPNGLSAAITLAEAGRSVVILEANESIGGGLRSQELTLPGFIHDVCAEVLPLGVASPFFRRLNLDVEWAYPKAQFAHALDTQDSPVALRSVLATAAGLGPDGEGYIRLMEHAVAHYDDLVHDILGPLRLPKNPIVTTKFGLRAIRSAESLAKHTFSTTRGRALFAGLGAHSELPLTYPSTAGVGLMLGMLAHAVGWPFVRGGSQILADALGDRFRGLGGEIVTDARVERLEDLPAHGDVLFDTSPRGFLEICGSRFSSLYNRRLTRFRYGPGVFKLDYALDGPVPWRDAALNEAGTVHVGGTLEEVAESERLVDEGRVCDKPFLLVAQPSAFDPTRAPEGKHTLWAYCHVPNGSTIDMTDRIERQIERFAPGFRDLVLARSAMSPANFESHNANYVGGDINGGAMLLTQTYTRPSRRLNPYTSPDPHIFLCSASTPPGGGIHGLSGEFAARTVLKRKSSRQKPG